MCRDYGVYRDLFYIDLSVDFARFAYMVEVSNESIAYIYSSPDSLFDQDLSFFYSGHGLEVGLSQDISCIGV